MNSEIDIKTESVVGLLRALHYKGVLINSQHNFAWITGGANNGIDLSRDNGVASILITDTGGRYLFANKIEMARMLADEVLASDFQPVEYSWQEEKSDGGWLNRLASDIAGGQVVADLLSNSTIPSIEDTLGPLRFSLTHHESERFRTLGRDAGIALNDTLTKIRPGQTELEIASVMHSQLERYNIRSVVSLVAADDRIAKYRHPVPTANRFEKTVMLVACARRAGLTASLTRIATIGKAWDEMLEKTTAAAFVNASLWHATREGVLGRELYDVAAKAYAEVGCGDEIDKHHQGGAAGYRTRDWVAHPECLDQVQANQAFAWNPSITGTKVEETVIISDKCEVITASPGWPTITHTIDGVEYHSPGILEI